MVDLSSQYWKARFTKDGMESVLGWGLRSMGLTLYMT